MNTDVNASELQPLTNGDGRTGEEEKKEMATEKDVLHKEENKLKMIQEYDKKIQDYIAGFTVHGLTRVLTAPKIEALFWLVALFSAILMSVIVIHGLVTKFNERKVYTEIKSVLTEKNYFPSIIICNTDGLIESYFSYCGKYLGKIENTEFYNRTCNYSSVYQPPEHVNSSNGNGALWSNGLFNVTQCSLWGAVHNCTEKDFLSLPGTNHSCFIWNYHGKIHDMYSHTSLKFRYNSPKPANIIVVPQEHNITEVDLTKQVEIDAYKKYSINIAKMLIKRQPYPYPSNCITNGFDILPGNYARRTCIESRKLVSTFKKCGGTTDYMRKHIYNYMSPEEIQRYLKNETVGEMIKCIKQSLRTKTELCPFPCTEWDLATVTTFRALEYNDENEKNDNSSSFYHLEIQLQSVDSYKVMEEKPLYPWDQMACEIGGFLGLVMGASMLSMIEIISCTYFFSLKKLKSH